MYAETSQPVLRRGIVSGRGARHAPFRQPGMFELSEDVGQLCFGRLHASVGGPEERELPVANAEAPPRVRWRPVGRRDDRRQGLLAPGVARSTCRTRVGPGMSGGLTRLI